MKIRVGITREIIVDGQVDLFNVDTTAKDIGRDADTLVEFLELAIPFDTVPVRTNLI
jgi:hypothetical protein